MSKVNESLLGRDLFLRHTDKNGISRIRCHRVWDAGKFMDSSDKAARLDGGSVALSTESDYRAQQASKGAA